MKKNILIVVIVIILALMAGLILWLTSSKTGSQEITRVSTEKIYSPVMDPSGKVIKYYSPDDDALHQLDLASGKAEIISDKVFNKIQDMVWSPKADQFIMQITGIGQKIENEKEILASDPSLTSFWHYDLAEKNPTILNKDIESVTWTLDGEKIAYHYLNKEKSINNISLSSPLGENYLKIVDINKENVLLKALAKDILIYSAAGVGKEWQKVNLINKKAEKISLSREMDLSKTAWIDESSFIAAVSGKAEANDSFYRVDLKNNQEKKINVKTDIKKMQAQNLLLSPDQKTLYFTSNNLLFKLATK